MVVLYLAWYSMAITTLEERIEANMAFANGLIAKKPERYDATRLEAARKLALDPQHFAESIAKYDTTIFDCKCPDRAYRQATCKHMLACMLAGCIFAGGEGIHAQAR